MRENLPACPPRGRYDRGALGLIVGDERPLCRNAISYGADTPAAAQGAAELTASALAIGYRWTGDGGTVRYERLGALGTGAGNRQHTGSLPDARARLRPAQWVSWGAVPSAPEELLRYRVLIFCGSPLPP